MGPADDEGKIGGGIPFPGLDRPIDRLRILEEGNLEPTEDIAIERSPRLGIGFDRGRAAQRHHPHHAPSPPRGPRQPGRRRPLRQARWCRRRSREEHEPPAAADPRIDTGKGSRGRASHSRTTDDDRVGPVEIETCWPQPRGIGECDDADPLAILALQQSGGAFRARQIPDHEQDLIGRFQRYRQAEGGLGPAVILDEHPPRRAAEADAEPARSVACPFPCRVLHGRVSDELAIGILDPDACGRRRRDQQWRPGAGPVDAVEPDHSLPRPGLGPDNKG